MARTTTFTQAQLDAAKASLEELPDLSREKLGKAEVMESLKEQIVTLSNAKGYSHTEIKSALAGLGISVSTAAISELITGKKKRAPRKNIETDKSQQ